MTPYTRYLFGNKFARAAITKPNENTLTMLPVRSLVYVPIRQAKGLGRVMFDVNVKPHFILADHHTLNDHVVYLGLHVNASVEIQSIYTGVHPVTNMPVNEFKTTTKTIPAVFEAGKIRDEKSMLVEMNRYYLVESPSLKDKIDGRDIKSIQKISGIYRIEVN